MPKKITKRRYKKSGKTYRKRKYTRRNKQKGGM